MLTRQCIWCCLCTYYYAIVTRHGNKTKLSHITYLIAEVFIVVQVLILVLIIVVEFCAVIKYKTQKNSSKIGLTPNMPTL